MGFNKANGENIVAGMFGRELFELIYPNWWGGQGKISQTPTTQKVNEKDYEPGSNFATFINRPGWHVPATPDILNQRTMDFNQTAQSQDVQQSGEKMTNYHQSHRIVKETVDPVSMIVAGVPTGGLRPHLMHRAFDPDTFYGSNGLLNGGGEPVYPTYRPHHFQPPAHIPQVRDPTLRSLYPKKNN